MTILHKRTPNREKIDEEGSFSAVPMVGNLQERLPFMKHFHSCISPSGCFHYGIHKPSYSVTNLRIEEKIERLGMLDDQIAVDNTRNYPEADPTIERADWIFEIPNPFPFRGTTFIDKEWADASASNYSRIRLPPRQEASFSELLSRTGSDPGLLESSPPLSCSPWPPALRTRRICGG